MPIVNIPGVHTATLPVSGNQFFDNVAWFYTHKSFVQCGPSYEAWSGGYYPQHDGSVRACAAHHATYGSNAYGNDLYAGAPCSTLGPVDYVNEGPSSTFGWRTTTYSPQWYNMFSWPGYDVLVAQAHGEYPQTSPSVAINPTYCPSWLEAAQSVLPESFVQYALMPERVIFNSSSGEVDYRVGKFYGEPLPMVMYRQPFIGKDNWVTPDAPPGDLVASQLLTGAGETITIQVPDFLITDLEGYQRSVLTVMHENTDQDLGYADGVSQAWDDVFVKQSIAVLENGDRRLTFTGSVLVPPTEMTTPLRLRQINRNDGLGPGGAPRTLRGRTSRQLSLRQRGYW